MIHNIVQVRYKTDADAKRYTFNVPEHITLYKGDLVRVRNCNGKEDIGFCVTDSEPLSQNAVDMIMSGAKVKSDVIGIYQYTAFGKDEPKEEKEATYYKTCDPDFANYMTDNGIKPSNLDSGIIDEPAENGKRMVTRKPLFTFEETDNFLKFKEEYLKSVEKQIRGE